MVLLKHMAINSMKPKSAIAKGKILENYVAKQLQLKGIDSKANRSHGSGNTNTEKSDIWTSAEVLGQNIGFECKNQKKISIPQWWKQTQKLQELGREPVLVFKEHGKPLEETLCTIYLDTFLELVKASMDKEPESPLDIGLLKYRGRRVREELRLLLKELDDGSEVNPYRIKILREEINAFLKDLD